ncbi:MAG: hypothetical protein B7O98_01105 [Zestosphaera tikiterensis]|uniref:Phosphoribosyltransferase domain-containing protein n=1 Tax=Zestosphaera tikiterensis TaxID=1973259 RepID=A0A2R7Y937_9CREN|nr:MAG: hypothetical protein B7O98_01105 [Zestosphaera tikiterensis]
MAGLLAIHAFDDLWDVTNYVRYGAISLRHRGEDSVVVCLPKEGVKCLTFEEPDEIDVRLGSYVAVVGTYNDVRVDEDYIARGSSGGVEVVVLADRPYEELKPLANAVAEAVHLSSLNALESGLRKVFTEFSNAPTLLTLSSRGDVIAWRCGSGLTPLVLGSYGFDLAIVASEHATAEVLGAEVKRGLPPGEGVIISKNLFKTFKTSFSGSPALCAFELLYLARPDSIVDGVSVYEFRKRVGAEVGKAFKNEVDVVVGVPETALPYALGFSQSVGKPVELALIPTGSRSRSMLKVDPMEKVVAIHMKMNPVKKVLEGRKVALVDDSMVVGSTMKAAVQLLRSEVGVDEIHLVVASPPIVSTCPYKLFNLNMERLLAANLTKDLAVKYLDVDSLNWVDAGVLSSVVRNYNIKLCGKCFKECFFG